MSLRSSSSRPPVACSGDMNSGVPRICPSPLRWAAPDLAGGRSERLVSLMFGLGMNNNGTGLVMASLALADHPRVLLPIIFYNLVQHLGAGLVDLLLARAPSPPGAACGAEARAGRLAPA